MAQGYRRITHAHVDADPPYISTPQHSGPMPHGVGCIGCRDLAQCNECGASYRVSGSGNGPFALDRCTNGRCPACHASVCGEGERHAPYRTPARELSYSGDLGE